MRALRFLVATAALGLTLDAVYVCPMHPDVTATAPGTCSKCGMKLVLKK